MRKIKIELPIEHHSQCGTANLSDLDFKNVIKDGYEIKVKQKTGDLGDTFHRVYPDTSETWDKPNVELRSIKPKKKKSGEWAWVITLEERK